MGHFIVDLSVLLVAVAALSYVTIVLKQPIIIAYIFSGIVIGPWGSGLVRNLDFIEVISHLGITLLLFLAGLNLHPQQLLRLFQNTSLVTLVTSGVSFLLGVGVMFAFGYSPMDSLCVGLAVMFSSTILTVKLLPTTQLHHERMGAVCIGVLILQDLLAIAVLAFIRCWASSQDPFWNFAILTGRLIIFIGLLILFENYILRRVMKDVERLHEALFIFGLAWCFGIATISNEMGLYYETGAFFAGVVLARHPISRFIAEKLKPLRDFFLVLFFFAMGAKLNLFLMQHLFLQAMVLTAVMVVVKPWIFRRCFLYSGEKASFAQEAGVRLGQLSEFAILVALLAFELKLVSEGASQLIQLTTMLTFIASSYIVVYKYPTPIGVSEKMTRD